MAHESLRLLCGRTRFEDERPERGPYRREVDLPLVGLFLDPRLLQVPVQLARWMSAETEQRLVGSLAIGFTLELLEEVLRQWLEYGAATFLFGSLELNAAADVVEVPGANRS